MTSRKHHHSLTGNIITGLTPIWVSNGCIIAGQNRLLVIPVRLLTSTTLLFKKTRCVPGIGFAHQQFNSRKPSTLGRCGISKRAARATARVLLCTCIQAASGRPPYTKAFTFVVTTVCMCHIEQMRYQLAVNRPAWHIGQVHDVYSAIPAQAAGMYVCT